MTLERSVRRVMLAFALCGASLSACASAPRATLSAEWLTPACEFPASFRVTLRNVSDAPFAVLADQMLGHGQPINFVATLKTDVFPFNGRRTFSSSSFFGPLPQVTNLVDLRPGESQVFEPDFNGVFDAHGGDPNEGRWRGRLQFYYALPTSVANAVPAHSAGVGARSNILECS